MMIKKSEHASRHVFLLHKLTGHMIKAWTEFGLQPKVFENPEMDYDDLNISENIGEERENTK